MDRKGALPKDIKQKNDTEILRSLAEMSTFTVQAIADETKISRLTITRALERLMDKGLIVQSGKGKSTSVGGKKPQEYSLNENRYVISIAPAQGKTLCSLMSIDGKDIDETQFDLPTTQTYEEYIINCVSSIRLLIERNKIDPEHIYGIVLCFGGIIDRKNGVFLVPMLAGWNNDLPIVKDISDRLDFKTRIEVENVSRVCSSMLRFDKEVQNNITAVMYTDYGVSILLLEDGKNLESGNNINGELGHMCLEPSDHEICNCGSRGCLEVLISQKRISALIAQLSEKDRKELLKDYDPNEDIRRYIFKKEGSGDPNVAMLTDYMARYIGLALRNVSLAVDPDLFVVQGVFSYASDRFYEKVKDVMRENKYLKNADINIRKEKRELSQMLKRGSMNMILSSILEE